MILIGLTGRKGCGKNTVAQMISDWAISRDEPLLVVNYGFSDLLKWAAMRMFIPEMPKGTAIALADELKNQDHSRAILLAKGKEIASISVRQLLQHAGTEVGRELFDSEFWVDALLGPTDPRLGTTEPGMEFAGMKDQEGNLPDLATISDVRFANEAQRIRDLDGQTWLISRGSVDETSMDEHVSETPLPPDLIDRVIVNDGDLDQLRRRVNSACDFWIATQVL